MSEKVFLFSFMLCYYTIAAAPLYANSICLKGLLMFIYLYAMKLIQWAHGLDARLDAYVTVLARYNIIG